jgi:peptide/nickel transport system permease protein
VSVSSLSTLPSAVLEEAPVEAAGQTSIVWKQFRKRPLAVASAILIGFFFTASVFAPLIASGMPYWYHGVNRFEYREALRTFAGFIDQIAKNASAENPGVVHHAQQAIRRQAAVMASTLDADHRAKLQELVGQVEASEHDAAALNKLKVQLRSQFDPRRVELVSRDYWPVPASLTGADVGFMLFNVMALAWPLWKWLLPRRRRAAFGWGLAIGVPLVLGVAWMLCVPERVERTPFKEGVMANDESDKVAKASVVYETVAWPPIPFSVDATNLNNTLADPSGEHWLGTDDKGRDVMSRMIWGGRVSLSVGIVAVSIYVTIGVIVGSLAGYFRGIWDLLISRVIEVVICFPSFFLILTVVAFVGPSIFNIMVVIGLIGWTGVAQLVRGEFLRLGEQEFILAGRALGFSPARIIFRHVLPNALAPVLVSATFGIAGAILTESGLSFLGLGITEPQPSWGGILSSGRNNIILAPWLIFYPGLAIFLTITAYNLMGEALRDAVDPRLRGRQ